MCGRGGESLGGATIGTHYRAARESVNALAKRNNPTIPLSQPQGCQAVGDGARSESPGPPVARLGSPPGFALSREDIFAQ